MADEPLVLVPGLLCDAALFAPQRHAFAGREIRIPELLSFRDIDAMASAVLADAPPRFALAGLSMGGYVALAIIAMAPERVTRLALLDSSARADDAAKRRERRGLIALAQRGRFKGVTRRLLPRLIHPDRLDDHDLTEAVMAMAARVGRDGYVRQQTAILGRPDRRDLLPTIDVPTLVLCGREDALTPPALSEEIAELTPGADLRLIDRCGHLASLEQPDAVNAAMADWLNR
jgi:pimeloyl-ACP methyl ester carboxylesterase